MIVSTDEKCSMMTSLGGIVTENVGFEMQDEAHDAHGIEEAGEKQFIVICNVSS